MNYLLGKLAGGFHPGLPLVAVLWKHCGKMIKSISSGMTQAFVTSIITMAKSLNLANLSFFFFKTGKTLSISWGYLEN